MSQSKMLNYLLGTTSKVEILRVLYESDDAMTGRRIAAMAGISPRSCQLSLDSLVGNKALFRKAVGRAYSYTLNRNHKMIWDLLFPVFKAEQTIHKDAGQKITRLCKPYNKFIKSIWWKLTLDKKSEYAHYVIVVAAKKGFPEKELIKKIDDSLALNFGFSAKCDVVKMSDFGKKYLSSARARKNFEKSFAKIKGLSFAELTGAKKKK